MAYVDEAAILSGCARGESDAVQAALRAYAPLVLAIARQTLRDPLIIEDAVHEVFIELWRSAGRFDPGKGSARTFVSTIARRRLIDRGRAEQVRVKGVVGLQAADDEARGHVGPGTAGGATGASRLASAEDAQRAARVIDGLGEPQRTAVRLSLGEGWSHQRISDHLGLPLGTVKSMLRSAVLALRAHLQEGEGEPAPAARNGGVA